MYIRNGFFYFFNNSINGGNGIINKQIKLFGDKRNKERITIDKIEKVFQLIISSAIIIGCGDCRIIVEIIEYIKKEHSFSKMDILTTAGGSRTISFLFYKFNIWEFFIFVIKKLSFYIDFVKYMGHNAETVFIIDHNNCGFWPKFDNIIIEDEEHIKSLRKAGQEVIKKFGKQIKEVILLYVITNKDHKVIKIKRISLN